MVIVLSLMASLVGTNQIAVVFTDSPSNTVFTDAGFIIICKTVSVPISCVVSAMCHLQFWIKLYLESAD